MTKSDIMRMAREAGLPDPMVGYASYQRFANLVAAAEREACAAIFDNHNVWDEEVGERIRARGTT